MNDVSVSDYISSGTNNDGNNDNNDNNASLQVYCLP